MIDTTTLAVLVVFITMKLTGNLDWSWWWVLSPLPIWIGLNAIILAVYFAYKEAKHGK